MKHQLYLLFLFLGLACQQSTTSKSTAPKSVTGTTLDTTARLSTDSYTSTVLNGKVITPTYIIFNGAGSQLSGVVSQLTIEFPENTFNNGIYELHFKGTKKTLPPNIIIGTYRINGINAYKNYFDHDNEHTFYCTDAVSMDTYNKMFETYGDQQQDAFLEVLHFDLVVVPDPNNTFTITAIEQRPGTEEIIETASGKDITRNAFMITGTLQVKLMEASTKALYTISCDFKEEYNYEYSKF